MLKEITGDLLAVPEGILLHQVNCIGATGGLAGALKRKYTKAFDEYHGAVEAGHCAATCVIGYHDDKLAIAHIFGQVEPGANTDLKLVARALAEARFIFYQQGRALVPHYAPHLMGCGLGGGHWPDYAALLEQHLPDCIIVKLPS